ncbi:hypothetical protein BSKO_00041 [Bryopsis sp. KO-2023]|nr:hypothetical protein BSKO_00041 [Bryopsis sp. KO-2023]
MAQVQTQFAVSPVGLAPLRSTPRRAPVARRIACRAEKNDQSVFQDVGKAMTAFAAASCLSLAPLSSPALASEFDILTAPKPTSNYVIDDAKVINKATENSLNKQLFDLEAKTGFRLEVATVRKLEFETDAFAFGDKVIEKWYPTLEEGTNKGILVVVTTAKDGAVTGGPAFLKAVGDDLIDSIISDQIPILTEQEKFNETATSTTKRLEAVLSGNADPGGPSRKDDSRVRTYRTKDETSKTRGATSTIVLTLLFIAVVVPMIQYYGYTAKE